MHRRRKLTRAASAACVWLFFLVFARVTCASRVLAQANGDTAPAQPSGSGSAPPGDAQSTKVTVSSPEELVERVRQGWQYIEVTDHLDVSSTVGHSQDVLLFSSRGIFLKVLPPHVP